MGYQLERRNLSDLARIELARVLKPEIQERAKENQSKSEGRGKKGLPISADLIDTRKELANEAGVGHDTFRKGEYILDNADAETIAKVNSKTGTLRWRGLRRTS